ncbi:MAG: ATP-binding protein [Cyanobacteria bacterium P01_G01_bin.54]
MITEVILENFKSHRHTQLKFDDSRLHAIVGQNSSGKTSVLQAIYYWSKVIIDPKRDYFQEEREPKSLISKTKDFQIITTQGYLSQKSPSSQWKIFYGIGERTDYVPHLSITVDYNSTSISSREDFELFLQEKKLPFQSEILHESESISYTKLVKDRLSPPSYIDDVKPNLSANGFGLAAVIDYIRDEDYDAFKEIERMLKSVVPEVKKLRIRRAKLERNRQRSIQLDDGTKIPYQEQQELIGKEVVLDMKSGDRIPGHALSEGTILTLGLLTVLMSPQRPNLILLDDIQQGLHPKAQLELMTVIKGIIQENPELQIIFTTHSPYILDELEPSQVHVLNTDENGYTISKRLDEHPDIEWAMKTLSTGEIWDAEGEEWVTADEPQAAETVEPEQGEEAAIS